jgi:hypothetical protein
LRFRREIIDKQKIKSDFKRVNRVYKNNKGSENNKYGLEAKNEFVRSDNMHK